MAVQPRRNNWRCATALAHRLVDSVHGHQIHPAVRTERPTIRTMRLGPSVSRAPTATKWPRAPGARDAAWSTPGRHFIGRARQPPATNEATHKNRGPVWPTQANRRGTAARRIRPPCAGAVIGPAWRKMDARGQQVQPPGNTKRGRQDTRHQPLPTTGALRGFCRLSGNHAFVRTQDYLAWRSCFTLGDAALMRTRSLSLSMPVHLPASRRSAAAEAGPAASANPPPPGPSRRRRQARRTGAPHMRRKATGPRRETTAARWR